MSLRSERHVQSGCPASLLNWSKHRTFSSAVGVRERSNGTVGSRP